MADRGPVSARAGAGADHRAGGVLGAGTFAALVFAVSALAASARPALLRLAAAARAAAAPRGRRERRSRHRARRWRSWPRSRRRRPPRTSRSRSPRRCCSSASRSPAAAGSCAAARGRSRSSSSRSRSRLVFAGDAMARASVAPFEHLRSEAFLAELKQGGVPAEAVTDFAAQAGELRDVVAVVFPAAWIIGAAVLVLSNAALLRLYLLRRDPGWLEDGEFERVRFPLALVAGVHPVGRGGRGAGAAAVRLQRASRRRVLLRAAGHGRRRVLRAAARRAAAAAARGAGAGARESVGPADPGAAGAVRQLVRFPQVGGAPRAEPPDGSGPRRGRPRCLSFEESHGADPEGGRRQARPPRRRGEGGRRLRPQLPAAEGPRHGGHGREQGHDREGATGPRGAARQGEGRVRVAGRPHRRAPLRRPAQGRRERRALRLGDRRPTWPSS